MDKPIRVQLSRQKGYRMPANTVKCDRSSRYGNPFDKTQLYVAFMQAMPVPLIELNTPPSLDRCLDMFLAHMHTMLEVYPDYLEPLRGKNLACWCRLDAKCHVDVLLRLANGEKVLKVLPA